MANYKEQFPIFKNDPELIYFDNAATSQKPQPVIDAITNYYKNDNANVHRGIYPLAERATKAYEEARIKVARFINADPNEIIFTSGATEGINHIARSLKESGFISNQPRIVLTDFEHHSNILPWQALEPELIQFLSLNENYELAELEITPEADIMALVHMSNVTGTILPIKKLTEENPYPYSLIDASQSVAHIKVDVKELDVDFLVFSGHKLYGPTGIGVAYIRKEILDHLLPFNLGGGMIDSVTREEATWASGPEKFEAGTPNIEGAVGLAAAIDFIESVGFDEIHKIEEELRQYALEQLKKIDKISIYHPSATQNPLLNTRDSVGPVISFSHQRVHAHDIAQYLGDQGICVRAGHHCTQVLHRDVLNIPASVRVSFGIYNTKDEIDKFIEELRKAIEVYS